jgi:hypothetical protein
MTDPTGSLGSGAGATALGWAWSGVAAALVAVLAVRWNTRPFSRRVIAFRGGRV